jgi:hypothetical protein
MELISNSRELFIIENVINYLQTTYPDVYSDKEIIRNYIEYNKLYNKKKLSKREKTVIFTQEEKERLEELNTIFFGNEEGTFNTYVDLPGNYLMTIRTIKQLINSTNKSIDDIIKEVYSLFENEEITKDEKFLQDYLNTIIIPSLLTTLDTHYVSEKIDHKIDRQEHTFDNAQIIQEEREKLDEKQRKKEEEIRKREEIEKKEIEKAKVRKVKQDELNEKLKAKLVEKDAESKNKQKDEKKTFIKNFNDNFEKLKYDLMMNPDLKNALKNFNDYDNCMKYLLEHPETDENVKKIIENYCNLLKLKKDINDEKKDISQLQKLEKSFNSSKKDLVKIQKSFSKQSKEKKDKDLIDNQLKLLDDYINANIGEYAQILTIDGEQTIPKMTSSNMVSSYFKIKIKEFYELQDDIYFKLLYNQNQDFKTFIKQLFLYYGILYSFFNSLKKSQFYYFQVFIDIFNNLITSDTDTLFKLDDKNKLIIDELINEIRMQNINIRFDKVKFCLFLNIFFHHIKIYLSYVKLGEDRIREIFINLTHLTEKYLNSDVVDTTNLITYIEKTTDFTKICTNEYGYDDVKEKTQEIDHEKIMLDVYNFFYLKYFNSFNKIKDITLSEIDHDHELKLKYEKLQSIINEQIEKIKRKDVNLLVEIDLKNFEIKYDDFIIEKKSEVEKLSDLEPVKNHFIKIYINNFL